MKYANALLLAFVMSLGFSCEREPIQEIGISEESNTEFDAWFSFFESKTKDWRISFSNERTNSCGWSDNPGNTIDCSGGDCYLRTDVPGFDVCIGCTVSTETVCFGTNGGTILGILNEMAVLYPAVEVDYEVFDEDGSSLGETEGELGSKISAINSLSALDGAATYSAAISSN